MSDKAARMDGKGEMNERREKNVEPERERTERKEGTYKNGERNRGEKHKGRNRRDTRKQIRRLEREIKGCRTRLRWA